ncbi:MAG: VOC family protein [Hyphomicrobiaceae bacterium]|nr:VOC family protein [Hyphomicrobiaceae bacterium]
MGATGGQKSPSPTAILETVLYAEDLEAAEAFYSGVLGFEVYARSAGRQVFYRCGDQMLLIFNPKATQVPMPEGAKLPVPPHGAFGPGHVCFASGASEIDAWKSRLEARGIAIEADFNWPAPAGETGGRSIYFRDPAGNCLEFAEPRIWGIEK